MTVYPSQGITGEWVKDEINRCLDSAMRATGGRVDRRNSVLLIRKVAFDFLEEWLRMHGVCVESRLSRTHFYRGIPVRITSQDPPDCPMVQLLMDPKIVPRRESA